MNLGADTNETGNKRLTWRWMILVSVSVAIVLVVISPTVMFIIGKSNIDVQFRSHCWDLNVVYHWSRPDVFQACTRESIKLTQSVCASYLSSIWSSDSDVDDRFISLVESADCSLLRVDYELSFLFTFLHLFSPACAAELPTALCRHYFRPCSDNQSTVISDPITSEECLSLTNYKCRVEVPAINNFITAIGTCLAMPDCHSMPEAESQSATSGINPKKLTKKTEKEVTSTKDSRSTSTVRYDISTTVPSTDTARHSSTGGVVNICPAPLKNDPANAGHRCILPCPIGQYVWESSFVRAFEATAYTSLIVEYFCCFIIFYTWARARQL